MGREWVVNPNGQQVLLFLDIGDETSVAHFENPEMVFVGEM